ncbi:unnamed protein product [Rotaria sp. Silwood1]|nr:unnamed protein product [Rotaria sp. Silwood1]CAF3348033.1 unnamed protein product [Rotaria sp. Silwood1]CAF3371412.1 unnamed protein product [Rotaria sp. Silwood1]CAF3372073.1 unnamed protein product [Rotaria sp. Silwood1]CAF3418288.1 unnamed protein product [Rotaria sp. Silwood1]
MAMQNFLDGQKQYDDVLNRSNSSSFNESNNNTKENKNEIDRKEIFEHQNFRQEKINKINQLIENLIENCKDIPGLPYGCFIHMKSVIENINTATYEKYDVNDIHQSLLEAKKLIDLMNLNDTEKNKLQEIIFHIEEVVHELLDHLNKIELQLNDIIKEKEKIQYQYSNICSENDQNKKQNQELHNAINDLHGKNKIINDIVKDLHDRKQNLVSGFKDLQCGSKNLVSSFKHLNDEKKKLYDKINKLKSNIGELQKKSSNRVLKEVFAHLLTPCIERIKDGFDQMNEEKKRTFQQCYEFQKYYNARVLEKIKYKNEINDDEPLTLIREIIEKFSNEANLSTDELIEVLIDINKRNYKTYDFTEDYINDFIDGECTENDLIQYIEDKSDVAIMITDNEKDILTKLIRFSIAHRQELIPIQSTVTNYFGDSKVFDHYIDSPFRMSIVKRYKNMGTIVMGKIESGSCRIGDQCLIMPIRKLVKIINIYYDNDIETDSCICGENIRLKLKNVEEQEISSGFILCHAHQDPCSFGRVFEAQITILEHTSIIYPGYSTVLHIHAAVAKVQFKKLIRLLDNETNKTTQENPTFITQNHVAIAIFELSQAGQVICMEPFNRFPQLGQFTLRDNGRTFAVGNVLKIIN